MRRGLRPHPTSPAIVMILRLYAGLLNFRSYGGRSAKWLFPMPNTRSVGVRVVAFPAIMIMADLNPAPNGGASLRRGAGRTWALQTYRSRGVGTDTARRRKLIGKEGIACVDRLDLSLSPLCLLCDVLERILLPRIGYARDAVV